MEEIAYFWQSFDIRLAIIIFFAYLVIDALYAYYTISVIERRPFVSANTGFIMHFLLAFGVVNYVQNYLYVLPLALGSWIGTYIIVSREKNNK